MVRGRVSFDGLVVYDALGSAIHIMRSWGLRISYLHTVASIRGARSKLAVSFPRERGGLKPISHRLMRLMTGTN